jgi:hypothetical protein
LISSDDLPPEHTVVIEADIQKAPNLKPRTGKNADKEDTRPEVIRISNRIRDHIYQRCSDSDMKANKKRVDPVLKLYLGAHCIINDNDNIAQERANGTYLDGERHGLSCVDEFIRRI